MLGSLQTFFESLTPLQVVRDILDIFLVYYIVYRAFLVLRGTRAMQVGVGLAMVFVLYIVAQLLKLVTVLNIMGALISSMILIIVVVFQNDIRRGLQRVGSRAWFGGLAIAAGYGFASTGWVGAAMSVGGLVVFAFSLAAERRTVAATA